MQRTSIQYLTHTWNPIKMRCTPVSAGCDNCWHLAMAKRLAKNPKISPRNQKGYSGEYYPFTFDQEEIKRPLHLKKPGRIGVQFMGDLFHDWILDKWLQRIWEIMASCPQHTFFILTKRPENTRWIGEALKNLWLGVSVEDQKTADERIPILLQIYATHRWVSIEPMLGPVDLEECLTGGHPTKGDIEGSRGMHYLRHGTPRIDWVVLGGETGPRARPLHPDWVRSIRDQCQAAEVSFFFKSWGEWIPEDQYNQTKQIGSYATFGTNMRFFKVGHKHSDCLLDGREWNEQ